MRYLIIVMLSLFSLEATSQARVGIPIDQVKKDFPSVQKIDSVTYWWETANADVYYLTYGSESIIETVIYPKSTTDERMYINFYNKQYIREGYAQWSFQDDNNDTVRIFKINRPQGGPYFLWTYYPNLSVSRDVKRIKPVKRK
jgi:hypothetical protein